MVSTNKNTKKEKKKEKKQKYKKLKKKNFEDQFKNPDGFTDWIAYRTWRVEDGGFD